MGTTRKTWLILTSTLLASCAPQPKREVTAKVVSISFPYSPRWRPGEVAIEFQTNDGLVGRKTMLASLNRCKVGDTVRAHAQGLTLNFDEKVCQS